jgi:acyl carrier protein
MNHSISEKVNKYITEEIFKRPEKKLEPGDTLLSNGLVDSFHLVDLALFIEDNFGIRIDDSELNASTFDTIEQLVNIIESRQMKK